MAERGTLLHLRALAAIHGGRVVVEKYPFSDTIASYVLFGRGARLALCVDRAGRVDMFMVAIWAAKVQGFDMLANASFDFPPKRSAP